MAQLYPPESDALHSPNLREFRLRMEFLRRAKPGGLDWYCW